MTKPSGQAKPMKPYKTFPLTAHSCGQWCKKIGGQRHHFGSWDDPNAALARYQKEFPYLHAGIEPPRDSLTLREFPVGMSAGFHVWGRTGTGSHTLKQGIREQVAAFDARVTRQRRSPLYSPGGYLVKAIQDGYATRGLRRARPLDDIGRTAPVVTKTSPTMADDSAAVTEYLNRLSSNERTELERDAIACSKGTMRAGYERSERESNDERAREYLKAMVAVYVKVLLKKQGKPEVHPPQVTR